MVKNPKFQKFFKLGQTMRSIDKIRSKSFYKFVGIRKKWLKDNPWCVYCLRDYRIRRLADVVDHIVPHKGYDALYLSKTNLQSLCKSCHDNKKQREDIRGYSEEVDSEGAYVDPKHPRFGF